MKNKIVINYIYSNIYQLLLLVTPLITTPYLTRVLKASTLSINTFTINIVGWFVLFGMMGINNYGNREIGKFQDNKLKLSKTFFEIYYMQLLSIIVVSGLYLLFVFNFNHQYQDIMLLQTLTLLSISLDITWFFYGVSDLKKITIRNSLVKIIGIVLIFIFVKSVDDLVLFILINSITGICGQFIMWFSLKKHIVFTKVTIKDVLKHYRGNFILFIPQIAISVYSILDLTMLGYLYEDIRHVNFYEQASKLVKMFMFFITSIGSIMIGTISNIYYKQDHLKISYLLNITFRLSIYLAIPMIVGINCIISGFIAWFLPSEYQIVASMIIYLSPIILFISLSTVYGIQYMIPTNKNKEFTISVVLGAIINFIVNLLLIPNFGGYGAIVGTLCAEFVVLLVLYLYIRKYLSLTISIRSIINIIISCIFMSIIVYYIGTFGQMIIINIIQLLVGVSVYVLVLIILKDSFIKDMREFIKGNYL